MKPRNLAPLVLALLTACASVGHKIDQTKVDQIQKGTSTKEDVRKLIGSPDQIVKDSEGNETWSYIFSSATAKPASFIPIVGAFAGGVNTSHQLTYITFGPDGKVSKTMSSTGGNDVSTGLSAAPKDKASMRPVEDGKRPK